MGVGGCGWVCVCVTNKKAKAANKKKTEKAKQTKKTKGTLTKDNCALPAGVHGGQKSPVRTPTLPEAPDLFHVPR